jgi:hypothetical protein
MPVRIELRALKNLSLESHILTKAYSPTPLLGKSGVVRWSFQKKVTILNRFVLFCGDRQNKLKTHDKTSPALLPPWLKNVYTFGTVKKKVYTTT